MPLCSGSEDFEAEWGSTIQRRGGLAAGMGARHSVLRFCAGDPQNDRHHHRGRGAEPFAAQDHRDARQFSNDEAAMKLLYFAIRNPRIHWRRPVAWTAAMGQFAIQLGERFAGSAD